MSTFVISCGGTGGHLAPGIALAEVLQQRGHQYYLVISHKEVDSRLIQKYDHLTFVRSPGVSFSWRPWALLRFIYQQFKALRFARRLIREKAPDAMLGFGGFITVGMSLASVMAHVPVVLHEANRRPGKAIRMLSGLAQRIYVPPGVRLQGFPPHAIRECGFPLRGEIRRLPRQEARQRLGLEKVKGKLLLVFGGSQGAASLNQWVLDHYPRLTAKGINILCITGVHKAQPEAEREAADNRGEPVYVFFRAFCEDMAAASPLPLCG